MTTNLNAALAHAGVGYAVFPCGPDKKRRVKWSNESTTDTASIRRWWMQWPDSLVGLDLAKSGTFVVDCDRHGGPDGVEAWEVLRVAYDYDAIRDYTVRTPSGGQHIYFRQDLNNRLGNRTGTLPQGIDVRGDGGYVIAAGSVLPDGRSYTVVNQSSSAGLSIVPAWLQTLINKRQPDLASDNVAQTRHEAPTDRERRYAAAALKEEAGKVSASKEGSRNTTLNTAAFNIGALVGAGWLDEYEATSALEIAAFMCGLDGNEIARTIKSGITDGKKRPRARLADWPSGYEMRSDGLYKTSDKHDDGEWICGPFTVLGEARTPNGIGWSLLISWRDGDGRQHTHALPRAELMITSYDVLKPLASGGLRIAADKASQLKQCLTHISTDKRVRIVHRTGWHDEAQFVLPTASISHEDNREVVIYDGSDMSAAYNTSGAVDDWRREIAFLADGNHRLMFAIAIAVAGTVADLLKEESLAFNYVGMSSSGKSTALRVAASVWGGKPYVRQWRATANGLEGLAKAHSGTCLILDELGQLDDRNAGDVAYLLVNGTGKSRAKVDGSAKEVAQWTLALLSSGETTLSEKIKAAGKRSKAGQAVRVIDIPADAGQGMGLFDDAKGMPPDKFSERLTEKSSVFFGTVGPAFAESIARAPQNFIRQLRIDISRIAATLLAEIPSREGQVSRIARRFAVVAAAGELLNDILGQPWRPGAMQTAAQICFLAALGRRGGTTSAEYTAIIDAVREVTEKFGDSRFHNFKHNPFHQALSDAPATLPERPKSIHYQGVLGYHDFHDGEEIWAFTETGFREIVGEIVEPRMAAQMLAEKGASLYHTSDKRYRWAKKMGRYTIKLYAVKASALGLD